MEKNIFDKISDSYEAFHLEESEIQMGNDMITISPKLKLMFGWSLFALCCILAYSFVGLPFVKSTGSKAIDKKTVLDEEMNVKDEHDTIVPYEKDADKELNAFVENYFKAITACDNTTLQEMVTDISEYNSADNLKRKAEFITEYSNITVYTKEGLEEGSYIAFVVANLTITGVNSSPYDIVTLYIVDGARGYLINNGTLSEDAQAYIEKVKGDKDIQDIYRAVEKQNNELKQSDPSLAEFYDIISRRNVETHSGADNLTTEQTTDDTNPSEESSENENPAEDNGETVPEVSAQE